MKRKELWWGVAAAVVLALLLLWGRAVAHPATSPLTTSQLAMTCTTDMATQFHIHPHLQIFINGAAQEIPAEIGITAACMHPIHTHDASGIIHVESPEQRDFTLGDFFAVWGKTFSKDQILDSHADATHTVTMTVNGQSVDTYADTILHDQDQIVIRYQ